MRNTFDHKFFFLEQRSGFDVIYRDTIAREFGTRVVVAAVYDTRRDFMDDK